MEREAVGIRELQQHASDVVRRVADGHSLDVTVRGRTVARIVPAREQGLDGLIAAGLARPATKPLSELPPLLTLPDAGPTLGELLSDARAEER